MFPRFDLSPCPHTDCASATRFRDPPTQRVCQRFVATLRYRVKTERQFEPSRGALTRRRPVLAGWSEPNNIL